MSQRPATPDTESLWLRGMSGQLAALSTGANTGHPLLALHGWLDNAASFIPLAKMMPDQHIVALEFPGHGHSDHRPRGTVYHFADYVADVAHAVGDLGWQRFTLMGHSLGANVALVFAATFPEMVDRLILIDGVGPTSGSADQAVARLRRSVDAGNASETSPRRHYADWASLIGARQYASPISGASAELLVRRGAQEVDGVIQMRSDRRLRQPSPLYLEESVVSAFVREVRAPVLLILAEDGVIGGRQTTRQRIALFEDIEVRELPGQHHLHMDDPEAVARVIETFCR